MPNRSRTEILVAPAKTRTALEKLFQKSGCGRFAGIQFGPRVERRERALVRRNAPGFSRPPANSSPNSPGSVALRPRALVPRSRPEGSPDVHRRRCIQSESPGIVRDCWTSKTHANAGKRGRGRNNDKAAQRAQKSESHGQQKKPACFRLRGIGHSPGNPI